MTTSKVFFTVLLGLVALQGIHGRVTDSEDQRGIIDGAITGILNAAMKVLDGLLDTFSKLADRVHVAIQNLVEKLAGRIQVIVNGGSSVIAGLAGVLGDKIQEAVKLGLINVECATARTSEVSEMVLNATNNLVHCPQRVEPAINEVVSELKTLVASLSSLLADGPAKFKACVPAAPVLTDLPRIGQCVRLAVETVVLDAAKLVGQIEHAITQSVRVSEESAAQVAACVSGTTEEASKDAKLILDHLSVCIADQSTTSIPSSSTPASTSTTHK